MKLRAENPEDFLLKSNDVTLLKEFVGYVDHDIANFPDRDGLKVLKANILERIEALQHSQDET
jgi:hypothetical protein